MPDTAPSIAKPLDRGRRKLLRQIPNSIRKQGPHADSGGVSRGLLVQSGQAPQFPSNGETQPFRVTP